MSLQILSLVNGSSLVQSELLANFSLVTGGATDAGGFSMGAVLGMNNGTEVTIYLNGSYSGSYVTEVGCPFTPATRLASHFVKGSFASSRIWVRETLSACDHTHK